MNISIIAAVANNNVIGHKNALPWHIPEDLKHFKYLTMNHHILMGQKTFESIGRPLPGRTTIILSDDPNLVIPNCKVAHSIDEALKTAKDANEKELFVSGGASIYRQLLPLSNKMYLTKIDHEFEGDTYFPEINEHEWKITKSEKVMTQYPLKFITYERK